MPSSIYCPPVLSRPMDVKWDIRMQLYYSKSDQNVISYFGMEFYFCVHCMKVKSVVMIIYFSSFFFIQQELPHRHL